MIQVILYSREDCHLCRQAQADLEALQSEIPHQLAVVDVDRSPTLQEQYGLEIPVVEVGPLTLRAPITRQELRQGLQAAQREAGKAASPAKAEPAPTRKAGAPAPARPVYRTGAVWTRSDSITYWFSRHILLVLNLIMGLYLGLAFLAPVLMKVGAQKPAALLYRVYSVACHQLAYRSFFLFGEQAIYPRASAGLEGRLTFNQATGISEGNDNADVFAAREFVGNPAMGYKVALCQRDLAIYGGILIFGLLYAATRRRIPALAWYLWALIGMAPIALDGFSQLFSQPPFNFIAYRESTPFFRLLTGFLFGFTTAWFAYPVIDQSMRETREMMEVKLRKTQALADAPVKEE